LHRPHFFLHRINIQIKERAAACCKVDAGEPERIGAMQRLARIVSRFRNRFFGCEILRCNKGAAVVEFALVAAPFLALLMALFQTVLVFFAERVLDETTEQASRYIMTGQAQQSNMTQSEFANYVCQNTFALFNCKNFMINVQSYNSFAAASTTTPTLTFNAKGQVTNIWTYDPGNPGEVVIVQVMYQWKVLLGPLGFNLSNISNGNRLLISTAAFRNEPF
jgi:Flp pilus assembly protein TadG